MAKEALYKLRGNHSVVEAEFKRVRQNLDELAQLDAGLQAEDDDDGIIGTGCCSELMMTLTDKAFIKPFIVLLVLFGIGFEWTGLPAIGFYAVTIMKDTGIPFDPFWMAAGLTGYRAIAICLFSGMISRCKRRTLYITATFMHFAGLSGIAIFYHLDMDGGLTNQYPALKYTPLVCIFVIYTAFSTGYGQVPYILQGEILPPLR